MEFSSSLTRALRQRQQFAVSAITQHPLYKHSALALRCACERPRRRARWIAPTLFFSRHPALLAALSACGAGIVGSAAAATSLSRLNVIMVVLTLVATIIFYFLGFGRGIWLTNFLVTLVLPLLSTFREIGGQDAVAQRGWLLFWAVGASLTCMFYFAALFTKIGGSTMNLIRFVILALLQLPELNLKVRAARCVHRAAARAARHARMERASADHPLTLTTLSPAPPPLPPSLRRTTLHCRPLSNDESLRRSTSGAFRTCTRRSLRPSHRISIRTRAPLAKTRERVRL